MTGTATPSGAAAMKASVRGVSFRSPHGLDEIQWRRPNGEIWSARPGPPLLAERMDNTLPVRTGSQYPNRRNQHGLYYWHRTGAHVWYESALELASLVELDFAGEAVSIASQPFRVLFRHGAKAIYHDPDFFAVHACGDQVVYDVKPALRMSPAATDQFAETARVCADIGWRHIILSETPPVRTVNLGFLRPVRLPRAHPDPDTFGQILNIFDGGRPIGEGRQMANRRFPALAMPHIRHLIWHRHLVADLDRRLDFDTVVSTSRERKTCCA